MFSALVAGTAFSQAPEAAPTPAPKSSPPAASPAPKSSPPVASPAPVSKPPTTTLTPSPSKATPVPTPAPSTGTPPSEAPVASPPAPPIAPSLPCKHQSRDLPLLCETHPKITTPICNFQRDIPFQRNGFSGLKRKPFRFLTETASFCRRDCTPL